MKYVLGLVAVLAATSVGCLSGSVAGGGALVHSEFPYAVAYDDERRKSVLGDEWTLENYRVASTNPDGSVELERKDGYDATYELDFDDDDDTDATAKLPHPDLVFVNRRTNARLEVTTLLLDKRLADRELRVLLSDIVEKDSGTRALIVGFGEIAAAVEKRFASKLLDSSEATLGTEKGLVATIERADLDQLQLNPQARWRRSRLLLVKAPFDYFAITRAGSAVGSNNYHKYRVLMLVEYSNTPEDFEAQYPDLVRLLNKIHLLSDDMLLEYLAEPLARCVGDKTKPAKLTVHISAVREAKVAGADNLDRFCGGPLLVPYRFAAKGEMREVSRSYDFSKPLKPGWLSVGAYKEERSAPGDAEAPAAAPDSKPADAPPGPSEPTAPAEPAPAPVEPQAVPATPPVSAP